MNYKHTLSKYLKRDLDKFFRMNPYASIEEFLRKFSDDHKPHTEYDDVMDYMMSNDGYMPGELDDGYHSDGKVYHDNYNMSENLAKVIISCYTQHNRLQMDFPEFCQYLLENDVITEVYGPIVYRPFKEIPSKLYRKYIKEITPDEILINRPRVFKDEHGIIAVQPNRYKALTIVDPKYVVIKWPYVIKN